MLRKTAFFAALPICLLVSACGDSSTAPLAPNRIAAPTRGASFSIYDGAHGGSDRFYFLPPLVSNPKIGPSNDQAIYPALTVTVCALNGTACVPGDPIVRYLPSNNASGKGDCRCGDGGWHHGSDDPDYWHQNTSSGNNSGNNSSGSHGNGSSWFSLSPDKESSNAKGLSKDSHDSYSNDRDDDHGGYGDDHGSYGNGHDGYGDDHHDYDDHDHNGDHDHDDNGSACAGTTGIALDGNHYDVVWNSGDFATSTSTDYRVTVFASGVELGHVDVDVLGKKDKAKADFIGLALGAKLDIPFRVTSGVIQTIQVSPADTTVSAGAMFQYRYNAVDYSGAPATGRTATWSSSNPAVATIDQNGVLKAVGAGTTTVTLTVEGHTATATVTVLTAATSFTVAPTSVSLTLGATTVAALNITATGANGAITSGLNPTWTSDNTNITVTPSATGFAATVSATTVGIAHITVTLAGLPAQVVTVTVNPAPAPAITLGANANFAQVTLNPATIFGAAIPAGATISFSSSDPTVAQVDPTTGVVTPRADGSSTVTMTVTAANGQIIGTQVVAVQAPTADACVVSANNPNNVLRPLGAHIMHIFAPGEQIATTVTSLPAGAHDVFWTLGASPSPVAVVANGASATLTAGQSAGNVTLNASAVLSDNSTRVFGVACLYVTGTQSGGGGTGVPVPVPTTVVVSPASTSLAITDGGNQTLSLTATVYDQNHNQMDASGLSFTWASGSGAVSVTSNGSATALIQAQTPTNSAVTITASISGGTAHGSMSVTSVTDERTPAATPSRIIIDPATVSLSILADGSKQTQTLHATVLDQNGNTIDATGLTFQWASPSPAVSLTSNGSATATIQAQQASNPSTPFTVTASVGNASGSTQVTVTDLRAATPAPDAPTVVASLTSCTIGAGQTLTLSATPPVGGSIMWTLSSSNILFFTAGGNGIVGSTVTLQCKKPPLGAIPVGGVVQTLTVVAKDANGNASAASTVLITVLPAVLP